MLEWSFHGNLCRTIGPLTLHSQEIVHFPEVRCFGVAIKRNSCTVIIVQISNKYVFFFRKEGTVGLYSYSIAINRYFHTLLIGIPFGASCVHHRFRQALYICFVLLVRQLTPAYKAFHKASVKRHKAYVKHGWSMFKVNRTHGSRLNVTWVKVKAHMGQGLFLCRG